MWQTQILQPFPLEQRLRRGPLCCGCEAVWQPQAALRSSCDWVLSAWREAVALCTQASADCGQELGTYRPRPPGFTTHPQRPGGPCAARQPNLASYIQS